MKTRILIRTVCQLTLSLAILLLAATTFAYGGTEIVLHNFGGGTDGAYPASALIFDTAGNLYGTTTSGGTARFGTVFKLTPNNGGFTESVIYAFLGSAMNDGSYPQGALTADSAGNLYGVTSNGGNRDCGTVFKLTPGSNGTWTESVLYSFCASGANSDGSSPTGKLIFDSAGNLYGVTDLGGTHNGGVVFELTPSAGTWIETVLYSFHAAGHLDGYRPSGIIFDSAGNIDGVTLFGGTQYYNGAGVVFQLVQSSPGHWTEKVIHTFGIYKGTNLQTPTGGLIFDAAGNLYMTMGRGGRGGAGIVELSPSGGGFTAHKLYSFAGTQILQPYEGLVFDSAGNLYSASNIGGSSACSGEGCGFVYRLTPGSTHWTATKLTSMNFADGANPVGGVILDSKGNVYGVTFAGGAKHGGVVFEITP